MAAKSWLPKLSGLRRFLEQERAVFAAAPILLIQSQPLISADTTKKNKNDNLAVSNACRHVQFLLSQQMGLHIVMVEHPTSYVYPTSDNVNKAIDLCRRVGAETVVGVGSGSAMDLAKAVVQTQQNDENSNSNSSQRNKDQSLSNLILVPATYGGVLAAATSHSLLLDTAEEALTVFPSQQQQQSLGTAVSCHVALEESMMDDSRQTNALFASIAIALHVLLSCHGQSNSRLLSSNNNGNDATDDAETALWVVQNALACLNNNDVDHGPKKHDLAVQIVATAGTLVKYGLPHEDTERSIPLALAASLIPEHFSEYDPVTFMASLVSAMLEIYCTATAATSSSSSSSLPSSIVLLTPDLVDQIRQHCLDTTNTNTNTNAASPPRIVTTAPVEALIQSVRDNQALWNCIDASDKILDRALEQHCLA
jgi:hypothetical protein